MAALSLCPHRAGRENQRMRERGGEGGERESTYALVSLIKALILSQGPHIMSYLILITSKALSPNTVILGLSLQYMNLGAIWGVVNDMDI